MKAYRFRLATVERIRELEERVARDAFMTAVRAVREARGLEEVAHRDLLAHDSLHGVVSGEDVRFHVEQAERLAATLEERREIRRQRERDALASRERWDVASRRATVLARLDEDAHQRWRQDVAREEVAEADDLTTSRVAREEARA